jgi:hypothetical protein
MKCFFVSLLFQDEDILPADEWFLLEDSLLEKQLFKAVVRCPPRYIFIKDNS